MSTLPPHPPKKNSSNFKTNVFLQNCGNMYDFLIVSLKSTRAIQAAKTYATTKALSTRQSCSARTTQIFKPCKNKISNTKLKSCSICSPYYAQILHSRFANITVSSFRGIRISFVGRLRPTTLSDHRPT
jgi:hypothetical protein